MLPLHACVVARRRQLHCLAPSVSLRAAQRGKALRVWVSNCLGCANILNYLRGQVRLRELCRAGSAPDLLNLQIFGAGRHQLRNVSFRTNLNTLNDLGSPSTQRCFTHPAVRLKLWCCNVPHMHFAKPFAYQSSDHNTPLMLQTRLRSSQGAPWRKSESEVAPSCSTSLRGSVHRSSSNEEVICVTDWQRAQCTWRQIPLGMHWRVSHDAARNLTLLLP